MSGVMTDSIKVARRLLAVGLFGMLVACGGGGGSTAPFGGTTSGDTGTTSTTTTSTATAAAIDVVSSATVLGTGSSDTVTITATVKTSGNVGIAGAAVTFSTDTGSLTGAATVTDSTGKAVATLSAGSDKTNRTIQVTVKSGSATGSTTVAVVSATAATVDVVSTANRVGTGGAAVTLTAVVKTANNVALASAPIQFSADTGSLVQSSSVTNASGAATATFGPGGDKTNRKATIKVTSGAVTGEISIAIDGTTLSVSGPGTLKLADTSQSSTYTMKATDSTGAAIANLSLSLSGALSNIPSGTKLTTDALGTASYTYTPKVAGSDVLTVQGAGATATASITVSGQDFSITAPASGANIAVDPAQTTGAALSVRYLVNGVAPTNGLYKVRLTSTAGGFLPSTASSTGVDLVSGVATVQIASRFAGPATVQATVFAPATPEVEVALATLTVNFVATVPNSLVLQVSPSAIGPNSSGSTTNQAEARATVTDAASNPVAGIVVNFSRVTDPSGGNLLQASATTDANGVARVQYVSGAQSTSTDGVTLQATVASNSSVSGQAKLTVNQNALFIALGTGNTISNVNTTTYQKQWTAYVTDATGAPVPNVTLTISALPTEYGKGSYAWNGTVWAALSTNIVCPSEDTLSSVAGTKNNGVLDSGEDVNGSLKLEPGNVISINGGTSVTTLKTDSTGFAILNLQYAESYAYWVRIDLKVAANVAGTEASNTVSYLVEGLSGDYTVETTAPAGMASPFGQVLSCLSPK
jgi:Bacterial Ig-like domain (group 1)